MITFDFDSTITLPRWSEDDELWLEGDQPNTTVVGLIRRFASFGNSVFIATSASVEASTSRQFVEKHNLPIVRILHTTPDKVDTLKECGGVIHFDDDIHTINALLKDTSIVCVWVPHPLDVSMEMRPNDGAVHIDKFMTDLTFWFMQRNLL